MVTRGDILRARLPKGIGHEQGGARYAVVLQADELGVLSTALIAPTSRHRASASFRPDIEVRGERTRVLTEQIRAVDQRRLGDVVGRLTLEEMGAVDDALRLVFALR